VRSTQFSRSAAFLISCRHANSAVAPRPARSAGGARLAGRRPARRCSDDVASTTGISARREHTGSRGSCSAAPDAFVDCDSPTARLRPYMALCICARNVGVHHRPAVHAAHDPVHPRRSVGPNRDFGHFGHRGVETTCTRIPRSGPPGAACPSRLARGGGSWPRR